MVGKEKEKKIHLTELIPMTNFMHLLTGHRKGCGHRYALKEEVSQVHGINLVLPMGTEYKFYLTLFDQYSAAMCIRKEKKFAFCRSDKDVEKVPEKKIFVVIDMHPTFPSNPSITWYVRMWRCRSVRVFHKRNTR